MIKTSVTALIGALAAIAASAPFVYAQEDPAHHHEPLTLDRGLLEFGELRTSPEYYPLDDASLRGLGVASVVAGSIAVVSSAALLVLTNDSDDFSPWLVASPALMGASFVAIGASSFALVPFDRDELTALMLDERRVQRDGARYLRRHALGASRRRRLVGLGTGLLGASVATIATSLIAETPPEQREDGVWAVTGVLGATSLVLVGVGVFLATTPTPEEQLYERVITGGRPHRVRVAPSISPAVDGGVRAGVGVGFDF